VSVASYEIFQAHAALEPLTNLAQDGIPGLVPQRIVHALEMVEVDGHNSARLLCPPAAGEFFLDAAHHAAVVGQTHQGVGGRQGLEPLVLLL
jgi:hypothetical protein